MYIIHMKSLYIYFFNLFNITSALINFRSSNTPREYPFHTIEMAHTIRKFMDIQT